jgi:hypothetical protein
LAAVAVSVHAEAAVSTFEVPSRASSEKEIEDYWARPPSGGAKFQRLEVKGYDFSFFAVFHYHGPGVRTRTIVYVYAGGPGGWELVAMRRADAKPLSLVLVYDEARRAVSVRSQEGQVFLTFPMDSFSRKQ